MTRPIVFSGPSLTPLDRMAAAGVEFRPPASQGDILRAVRDNPRSIGLVDGYFGDRLAVHQKEILEAMSAGVPVIGAASMGALRAAELASFGMTGVGKIFHDFYGGRLTSDAEVAVAHGPAHLGFAPTSVSLVDVRATLDSLRRQKRCDNKLIEQTLMHAKTIHFLDRTWRRIALELRLGSVSEEDIEGVLRRGHVQQKRLDAIALVRALGRDCFVEPCDFEPPPMTLAYLAIRDRSLSAKSPSSGHFRGAITTPPEVTGVGQKAAEN